MDVNVAGPRLALNRIGLIVLLLQLHPMSSAQATSPCPELCQCFSNNYVVCRGSGLSLRLDALPLNLSSLDVQDNQLQGEDLAGHLYLYQSLRRINLGYNSIQDITADMFSSLTHLLTLNLTYNQITVVNKPAFQNLTELETLDLSKNKLSSISFYTIVGLTNLRHLNLSGNNIQDVGNLTFIQCYKLTVLDLSYNHLILLEPDTFSGLVSLEVLHLQGNSLVDNLDLLGRWSLFLPKLLYLDISNNFIGDQENATISSFSSLQELDISRNELTTLPHNMLGNFTQLRVLNIGKNPLTNIEENALDGAQNLEVLYLDNCTRLEHIPRNLLQQLNQLYFVNLSHNSHLSYLPPSLFGASDISRVLDISHNNLTSLPQITFHNHNFNQLYINDNPFTCDCAITWIKELLNSSKGDFIQNQDSVHCIEATNFAVTPLEKISWDSLVCEAPILLSNNTDVYHPIGSSAFLSCDVYSTPPAVITWITPRKRIYMYHNYHPHAIRHLLSKADVAPGSEFHHNHPWHNSTSYYSDIPDSERVMLLDDGTLYIDYVQRQDGGPYQCIIEHPYDNMTLVITLHLDHTHWYGIKHLSIIIGFSVAACFFILAMVIWAIKIATNRCINQQKREAIKNIIDNLDAYKTHQIGRLKDISAIQMGRFKSQYHFQLERLRENYNQQMLRIRENCGQQMDKIKDNYATHVGRIKDYSSHRLVRLRDSYNTQIVRIREYGSLQLERLRDNYKLQQQHLIKLLETMNLDNCRTVIETDCVRAESMLFDSEVFIEPMGELPYLLATDPPSTGSGSELDYVTASSNSDTASYDEEFINPNDVQYEANVMQLLPGTVIQMPTELILEDGETVSPDQLLPPAPVLPLPTLHQTCQADETDSNSDTEAPVTRQVKTHRKKKHRRRKRGDNSLSVEADILLPPTGSQEQNCDSAGTSFNTQKEKSEQYVA